MTVIRPNSISGISSITAQGSTLEFFQNTGSTLSLLTDITGNADTATTAQGLTGTPNIVVGSVTGATASFSGNVSVGGTLTYEDVTNIDSVGLVTARTGLEVSAGTVYLSGITKEKAYVTTTTIDSNQTFDLNSGMVHFRNSSAPSAVSSNALLTYSPSNINTYMAINDVLTVTIMCTGASGSYFGGLSIDGVSQTVNWAGGAAPTDGSAKDIYVFTVVKTAASTYTVFGNQTKTA